MDTARFPYGRRGETDWSVSASITFKPSVFLSLFLSRIPKEQNSQVQVAGGINYK